MVPLPNRCPFGGGEIVVTQFYCPETNITIDGRFSVNAPFAQLSPEQLEFMETFVRCEGKLSRLEGEMGLSYPTLRNRLHDVIRALGYEPGKAEPEAMTEDSRKGVLDALDTGDISFEEAMQILKGDA